MTVVADLSVRVGAETSGLTSGLNAADQRVQGFGQRWQAQLRGMGDRALQTAGSLAGLAVPLGLGLGYGINAASDFEDSLTEIQSRTRLVESDMQRVSDFALQMGQDTKFSGQEAADGFLQLLTSGQSVEEAFSTLPPVLDLAAAAKLNLGQTADAVTDIMAQFGLSATEAIEVVDALARASGSSSATVADLQAAFANVGPVASSFDLSVNRTAAILAVLSENGIKSAEAGTALKSVLLNLQRDEAQRTLRQLGLSMYDTQGNMRDFEAVITELDAKLDGMSTADQNRIMLDLAGSYGITALTALRGSISIGQMEGKMLAAATASEIADSKMGTFSGKTDTLKGSIDTLMTEAMTPFIDNVLSPMVDHLTNAVNGVTDWVKENPQLTSQLIAVAGVAVGATAGLGAFGIAVNALSAGIGVLSVVGLPALLLIGGLVVGIGLMNTEVTEGITVWELFSSGVATVIDDIGRRLDILGLDFSRFVLERKRDLAALAGGNTVDFDLQIAGIDHEKAMYGVGDSLYQALGTQLRSEAADNPITLTPELSLQIAQDPATLAGNLSYPTRQMLTEAWNRASEQGDLDFLESAAPLVVALQEGGLVVPEIDGTALDTTRLMPSLQTAFRERITGMDDIEFPVDMWADPVARGMANALNEIAPSVLSATLDAARLESALNTAMAGTTLDLITPVMVTVDVQTGEKSAISLGEYLQIEAVTPGTFSYMVKAANPDLAGTLVEGVRQALDENDIAAYQLVVPVAVTLGAFEATGQDLGTMINTEGLINAIESGDYGTASIYLDTPSFTFDQTAVQSAVTDLLTTALNTEDAPTVSALTPLAVDLGMDVAALQAQHALDVTGAIETMTPVGTDTPLDAKPNMDVEVFKGRVTNLIRGIDFSPIVINAQLTVLPMVNGQPQPAVKPEGEFYTGTSYVPRDMLAYVHQGEVITSARDVKGLGGNVENHYHVASYGQSVHDVLEMLRREARDGAR